MAEKLELASKELGEQSNDDLFKQIPMMMRMFRAWAGTKIAPDEAEEPVWPYNGMADSAGANMMDPNQMIMMQSFDLGNDLWLEEIFGRS